MTSTNKGNYKDCKNCIFKLNNEDKYPCSKSHKAVREASGEILERNFKTCGLYLRNLELLEINSWNWAYVFGNIEKVKIIKFNSKDLAEIEIRTENGNKRNIQAAKVFPDKKDLINHLEKNKIALNLIKKYDLDVSRGTEDER